MDEILRRKIEALEAVIIVALGRIAATNKALWDDMKFEIEQTIKITREDNETALAEQIKGLLATIDEERKGPR